MAYNFDKDTCDTCGKKEPTPKRWEDPKVSAANSFRLGWNGSVLCASCHREKEIGEVFAILDARATGKTLRKRD